MKKKIPDLTQQLVLAMKENSNKWDFIVRVIEDEMKGIDYNIHQKKDDNGRDLDAKQIYDLLTWYGFLEYVIGLPEMILEKSVPKRTPEPYDFEVYPLKNIRDSITQDADEN